MSENGVCVECQTKHDDSTLKPVSLCPICKRLVCATHLRSMLAYIPDLKHTSKAIKEAKEIIEMHNIEGTGHSCLPYTMDFWKEFDLEKERKRQREKNAMDGFGYVTDEEINNISDRSLEEIQERLAIRNQQIVIPVSGEVNKLKEKFWEKLRKH